MGTSPKCLCLTIEIKVDGGIGGSGNLNIKGSILVYFKVTDIVRRID